MLGQLDHLAGQQLQRPARAARRRLGAGGRHQQCLLLAGQLARRAGARFLAERRFQITKHEAAFGPGHRRAANPDTADDLLVADPDIGGQQDLRPLQLSRPMLAAAQQRTELAAFCLAQFDPVPYIHSDLLEGKTRRIER